MWKKEQGRGASGDQEMRAMIFSDMARTQPKCLHCWGGQAKREWIPAVDGGYVGCKFCQTVGHLKTRRQHGSCCCQFWTPLRLSVVLYVPDSLTGSQLSLEP